MWLLSEHLLCLVGTWNSSLPARDNGRWKVFRIRCMLLRNQRQGTRRIHRQARRQNRQRCQQDHNTLSCKRSCWYILKNWESASTKYPNSYNRPVQRTLKIVYLPNARPLAERYLYQLVKKINISFCVIFNRYIWLYNFFKLTLLSKLKQDTIWLKNIS